MKSVLSPHSVISFWTQDDFLKVWNISGIVNEGRRVKLVNKTSNGLERQNCHFNGIVPTDHPNLVIFVQALQKEVDRVLARTENIDKGREDPPEYAEPVFPEIPSNFGEMIESHKEMHDEQVKDVATKKGRGRKATM